jgi:hypothetical protein
MNSRGDSPKVPTKRRWKWNGERQLGAPLLTLDGAPDVRKLDKEKPDSLDDWSKRRAAYLVRAGDLECQEARREQSLQSADARDVNGIGLSGPVRVKASVPARSPLPNGSQSGAPTRSEMCGGGW